MTPHPGRTWRLAACAASRGGHRREDPKQRAGRRGPAASGEHDCAGALLTDPEGTRNVHPDEAVIHSTILLLAAVRLPTIRWHPNRATGALRGAGRYAARPCSCHFTAYWILAFRSVPWLCFHRGWGAFGLWAGLSLALILIGIVLLSAWRRTVRGLMLAPEDTLAQT